MKEDITWVGIDDHKKHLQIAVLKGDSPVECVQELRIHTDRGAVRRLVRKLERDFGGEVRYVYEAGPLGYTLQRWVEAAGGHCEVVAPSRTPRRPGEKVKTDRRDARKLVTLYRAGLLQPVHPPDKSQEALRDLARLRDQAGQDMRRAMQRTQKLLLRQGLIWHAQAWTQRWDQWVRTLSFDSPVHNMVLAEYLLSVRERRTMVEHLDGLIDTESQKEPYKELIGWLRCFRGIDTLTAFTIAVTLYSPARFRNAEQLMSFLGLTGSESSSGERHQRGPITKQGDKLVRRLLVEAAKHQRRPVHVSANLRARRAGQPEWVIALADKAMKRLHRKYTTLMYRGKHPNIATAAVARELVGFLWELLQRSSSTHLEQAS
jgi:transposase